MHHHLSLARLFIQQGVGCIYLIAFTIAFNQFPALCGEQGLLPAPDFLKRVRFWQAPSLFHVYFSDPFTKFIAALGIVLSILAVTGFSASHGLLWSMFSWGILWFLYLSFVNIGQVFYGFGWESILLETGFLTIFLGSSNIEPPTLVFWLMRWVLFRVMFGAGLIKLRGDPCWRNLTCLQYHYETQPLPNRFSYYMHWLPNWFHKFEALATHFVELAIPFGFFLPAPICATAALITIGFQISLIASGNLSWLNYITLVLCLSCFDHSSHIFGQGPLVFQIAIIVLASLVAFLSVRPVLNMISPRQIMNFSYNAFHLVNTYGAFGSITKKRFEIIIEGTLEPAITPQTIWHEYEFKAKPGDLNKPPSFVAPYHLRIDWLMWFAAMSERFYHPWFVPLCEKLLKADGPILKLLAKDPFSGQRPSHVRALLYRYEFTKTRQLSDPWWTRKLVRTYLPPIGQP